MRPNKVCKIDNCTSPVSGRGYCSKHYQRLRRHGDPQVLMKPRTLPDSITPCAVEGCERYAQAKGMCFAHYQRVRRTGTPGPAQLIHEPRTADDTERRCSKCTRTLPVSKFPPDPRNRTVRLSICYACQTIRDRNAARVRRYGMTTAEYDALLVSQGGVCAVVGCGSSHRLVIDHCHASSAVRGIICDRCNVVLGRVEDTTQLLHGLAEYLGNHHETVTSH